MAGFWTSTIPYGLVAAAFVYDRNGDMDTVHRAAWSSSSSATARRVSKDTGDERIKE